jgi:uncharacterized protein (TIGR00288 family)
MADELLIAVFVDYENLAIGVRDMKTELKLDLVLKRLLEKGRIVFKRAYGDWNAYAGAVRELHALGISMMEMPRGRHSGKNSADIHMVVEALDLCYSKEHIDAFALLSGDSDFSPLVSKLKENNKRVIGCGVKNSTADLLIASCDEFIYYDDLVRAAQKATPVKKKVAASGAKPTKKEEALERLIEIVGSLARDYDPVWGSMVKQAIRRVYPGFNEDYYGYASFNDLLEDGADRGLIELDFDESRGNYKVSPGKAAAR